MGKRWCQIKLRALGLAVCMFAAACASQPPIVADPPQHNYVPPEPVPWEEQYARSRPNPEVFDEDVSSKDQQQFDGNLEHQPESEGGALQAVADVIAFPFRGVAWLLEQIF